LHLSSPVFFRVVFYNVYLTKNTYMYLSIIQNIFENIDYCPASILYYSKKIWRYQKGNQNSPFFLLTFRSFPHSWLITWFVTRITPRVPQVEQGLVLFPLHLSSPVFFRVVLSLEFCVVFLEILLRYTDSDYPFAIFKIFLRFFISILLWRFSS
jgi:hypothetical protein